MNRSLNILVISSYPPSRSGGIAQDSIDALVAGGHKVDFFTLYAFFGQGPNQYNILPEPFTDRLLRLKKKFPRLSIFESLAKKVFRTPEKKMNFVENHGYRIPHLDESNPPVSNTTLSAFLPNKKYDFVHIFVTERMLTTLSFVTIYKKYQVPLLITCMDMLHFTGGCYFFGNCDRFNVGCGKCLILNSDDENDQTRQNYLIKKDVYQRIKYAIICNLYQKKYALGSKLFDPRNIFTLPIIIDEDKFRPLDSPFCRLHFGIPSNKKFVILSRYEIGLGRSKGYDHLVKIVNIYSSLASSVERDSSLLVIIGSKDESFTNQINLDTMCLGRLELADLIKCYSAASVFISTSIDDAGPSMVNQSMMCGTPVVTFSVGTALEVTREGVNGFMSKNFDDEDFADKLCRISRLSDQELNFMRKRTRGTALELNSKLANAERIVQIYDDVSKYYHS